MAHRPVERYTRVRLLVRRRLESRVAYSHGSLPYKVPRGWVLREI